MGRPKKYDTEEERKQAEAERKRTRRANESAVARATRLEGAASYERQKREEETEEQRTSRLTTDAFHKKEKRQEETEEQRTSRLTTDASHKKKKRQEESEEQRKTRLTTDASHKKEKRQEESEEQRKTRLNDAASYERQKREEETEEQRVNRLEYDAINHRQQRSNETSEETVKRQENDRLIHLQRKIQIAQQLREGLRRNHNHITSDEQRIAEHTCGDMDLLCTSCNSLNFESEMPSDGKFSRCCHKGKVKIQPSLINPVIELLMKGEHQHSQNFMNNIRSYNSSFAFASMGASVSPPPGYGPYCLRIQGQIYHRTGTLHPADGDSPAFAQIYILDPSEANTERLKFDANQSCNRELMEQLGDLINEINPFAKAFRMLREVELEEQEKAKALGTVMPKISMAIKQDRNQDQRRYNNPRVAEVAVVFENEDGEPPFNRDILIHLRPDPENPTATKTQRINILHSNLDALTYPILFPYGEQGWHDGILPQVGNSKRVSQLQYYSYLLNDRGTFNPILNGGKLTQQYIVDAYVKIEANRLQYIRMNQKDLKVEDYCLVQEHLEQKALQRGIPIGRTVILPSSFEGSPRNMQQRYQDTMSIVTKLGKPDLFVTMTCNPKWKEILNNLEPWQTAEHRPDLVARVFKIKLDSLLEDLRNGLFGVVTAMVHVIEFQKRGLPHAHILVILDNESKIRTEEDIDNIVWAEIPSPDTYPQLHEIVCKHMIHGPCGPHNKNCPCMENGTCAKGFPKDFNQFTNKDRDGYPIYKRRHGDTYWRTNKQIDNSWVVPYNPYLLKKFNCHINVEICASIKSVKYLFKYVYKGHDRANIEVNQRIANHDEPTKYVDARYVSAPEACWRIFEFPMHNQSHSIVRLAVHLPNNQQIYFQEGDDANNLERKLSKNSTLMAWFELNRTDEAARQYFYWEIPEHYVWQDNKWIARKRGGSRIIGRMYTVNIKDQERFNLRLLLLHIKGAQGFDYMKTIHGTLYPSFKDASAAMGLLLDDEVWEITINEATSLHMPQQLREMFAYMCIFGPPSHPDLIWNRFKYYFVEDFCNRLHSDLEDCQGCENMAMKHVQEILVMHGKSFIDFGLPQPSYEQLLPLTQCLDVNHEHERLAILESTLNSDQSFAFNEIKKALGKTNGTSCFFIDGPGGSGKTYLYDVLILYAKLNNYKVKSSATTGIAANLLTGGQTMHSLFGLPVPMTEVSVSNIKPNSYGSKDLKITDLVIVDECTMAPKHSIGIINKLLQECMTDNINEKCTLSFGGKIIVFGGDFRQCLPVIPNGNRTDIVESCLKQSPFWNQFKPLRLNNNMRSVDENYSKWLLELGNGTLQNKSNLGEDIIEIPADMLSSGCVVTDVFGTNLSVDINDEESIQMAASYAILCPKNDDVEILNNQIMDRISVEYVTYLSDDSVAVDGDDAFEHYPVEFLNSITPSGMPAHRLRLKIGVIIMLLRNLNTRKGLCNGTRLIVVSLADNYIQAKVVTGCAQGDIVLIPRVDLCPSETGYPFALRRRQFPVKPAFAMTINKSQGQTFSKVGIYLKEPVFSHGQLYVAFSRVKRQSDVKVLVIDTPMQGKLVKKSKKVFTLNVVYKNVLY